MKSFEAIPKLSVQTEGLVLLENRLQEKNEEINQWFEMQWKKTPPPLYGSVDMRNAGFKLAPVDMNLFPAGFNNLNSHFLSDVIKAAKETIMQWVPHAHHIVLIPESHTRNLLYWESMRVLTDILTQAGLTVKIGSLREDIIQPVEIKLSKGKHLTIERLIRKNDKVRVGLCVPDLILLNNDLSAGIPPVLHNIQQQLFPPAELGWHQRLKSEHFQYYTARSGEFADILGIDPWMITPLFHYCGEIDFMRNEGLDCLMENVRALLTEIETKYKEYGVSHKPFVIVKSDAGTYGMAVMTVRSIDELRALNRKQRTTMAKSKGGMPVRRVIVQEGIYTFETYGPHAAVAEPVIYLWGKYVAGGFYRIHSQRGVDENLNAPGMHFESSPFAWSCCSLAKDSMVHPYQKHLYTYGVIAQLSMLAAAQEIHDQKIRD